MKNGKRIVLEASEGITFRVQEGTEEIIIKAINEYQDSIYNSECSNNYEKPYIPEGYIHLTGIWLDGFVIRNKADKSDFVWIPVGWLDPDGTLDGEHFVERFGRKNFYNSDFSQNGYHEELNKDFFESVKKYGGYYISRYHASKTNGEVTFKADKMPWVNVNYHDAEKAATDYAKNSKDVVSIITPGAAFDSMLRWMIKPLNHEKIVVDSTFCGNYWNAPNSLQKVMPTGSNSKWRVCNIYDVAGNVDEWTSEMNGSSCRVLRGGNYVNNGYDWPAASRDYSIPSNFSYNTSFRAVIYKKV